MESRRDRGMPVCGGHALDVGNAAGMTCPRARDCGNQPPDGATTRARQEKWRAVDSGDGDTWSRSIYEEVSRVRVFEEHEQCVALAPFREMPADLRHVFQSRVLGAFVIFAGDMKTARFHERPDVFGGNANAAPSIDEINHAARIDFGLTKESPEANEIVHHAAPRIVYLRAC
jgi:hypothetical protein